MGTRCGCYLSNEAKRCWMLKGSLTLFEKSLVYNQFSKGEGIGVLLDLLYVQETHLCVFIIEGMPGSAHPWRGGPLLLFGRISYNIEYIMVEESKA